MIKEVQIIGAGLAGCEAAWQLASRGIPVALIDMKPEKRSEAHHSPYFAELVCSNSLRSDRLQNAVGLLKEELRRLHSLILQAADQTRVPAGGALAVDREGFSKAITEAVSKHPLIRLISKEADGLPEAPAIIASGPLTSEALSRPLEQLAGERLHFFDAAAPIVSLDSIDLEIAFRASRYGRGEDYLNCPMDETQYKKFMDALLRAETAPIHGFEEHALFDGCMPIESIGRRGYMAPAFGPMKPVGLIDPKSGKEPFAVVQLRQDDAAGSLYNLVGFQTKLKFPEQQRVFRLIPGLENAEFARFGVMHRNSFLNSPGFLDANYQVLQSKDLYFAGQITGVEGYVESTASGLLAGISLAASLKDLPTPVFPGTTAIGALGRYISSPNRHFQPMNMTFGLMDPLSERVRSKEMRYLKTAERALSQINEIKQNRCDLFAE